MGSALISLHKVFHKALGYCYVCTLCEMTRMCLLMWSAILILYANSRVHTANLRNLATGSKSLGSHYLGYGLCDIKVVYNFSL